MKKVFVSRNAVMMKYLNLKTGLFILSLVIVISCNDKSLVGNWKIKNLTPLGDDKKKFPADTNDRQEKTLNRSQVDSIIFWIQNSYLTLRQDSSFHLADIGFLNIDPGRSTSFTGTWTFNDNDQVITLRPNNFNNKHYKLEKLGSNVLVINEIDDKTNTSVSRIELRRE